MKLFRSFVASLISEFSWIIISDFAFSRFPRPTSMQTEGKWEELRKDGMILQNQRDSSDRRKSGIMLGLVLGDGKERQGQVYFTSWVAVCKGFSRSEHLFSAQTLWVWRHGPCNKVRRPFVFPISKRNKNSGFSHVESGNRDTPKFVLKNRDIPIKSGWVARLKVPSSHLSALNREKYHNEKVKEMNTKIGQSTHPRDLQLIRNKTTLKRFSKLRHWHSALTPTWIQLHFNYPQALSTRTLQ